MIARKDGTGSARNVTRDELAALSSERILMLIPTRTPDLEWNLAADHASIYFSRKLGFLPLPGGKKVVFDKFGSFVVRASDGNRTAQEIAGLLAQAYGMDNRQAGTSLVQFLTDLHKRGYVQLRKPVSWGQQLPPLSGALPPARLCNQCGARLPEEALFCPQCGSRAS